MSQPNLSYIKNLSGGDTAFEAKLIGIIKTEFPVEKAVYQKNIESKNFKLAAENVHKLKHKISILGLEKSYKIAADYEDSLREHSFNGKEDFDNILETITNFLKTL